MYMSPLFLLYCSEIKIFVCGIKVLLWSIMVPIGCKIVRYNFYDRFRITFRSSFKERALKLEEDKNKVQKLELLLGNKEIEISQLH